MSDFLNDAAESLAEDPAGAVIGVMTTRAAIDVFNRLLGPSLDELGSYVAGFMPKRRTNAEKILHDFRKRTRGRVGSPSARIVVKALEEGSWTDDEFVSSYLGGVIAGSVTEESTEDDTGIPAVAQVMRLSSRDLRLHYMLYEGVMRKLVAEPKLLRAPLDFFGGEPTNDKVGGPWLWVSIEEILGSGWTKDDFVGAMSVLHRERLISRVIWGDEVRVSSALWTGVDRSKVKAEAPSPGLLFSAERAGLDLYLRGLGYKVGLDSGELVDFLRTYEADDPASGDPFPVFGNVQTMDELSETLPPADATS